MGGRAWTQNEIGELIDMMDSHEIWELAEHFERPKASIRTKIKELKKNDPLH